MNRVALQLLIFMVLCGCAGTRPPAQDAVRASGAVQSRDHALQHWVQAIVVADYEGDRAQLDRLYVESDRYLGAPSVQARVHYWRGFAKWRRAINGANETPVPTDLVDDVDLCIAELRRSGELDPSFVDARIGEIACMGLALFFDAARAGAPEFLDRYRMLLADLKVTGVGNPRYVWVWGMAYFNQPAERGGGADNVIAAYHDALRDVRAGTGVAISPLDPSWGEAELNVNLAYSYLNKPAPQLDLAQLHVDAAIRLVPTWHYARDILRPQIVEAIRRDTRDDHVYD